MRSGKNCATNKLPIDNDNVAIPVAAPLALIGNSSGNMIHKIGPQVNAKKTMNNVKHATIIHAPTVECNPIVHTSVAIISNEQTIPILPVMSSFLRSILSMIYIANIVTITLTDPIPTVPSIAVASPKPALLKIVGA